MQPNLRLYFPAQPQGVIPENWRMPLVRIGIAWALLILLFIPVWAEMAHQWWNISTYNHILLVPFILAWLVKMRLPELVRLEPQAWWPGLIPMSGALLLWFLGEVSGLNIVGHMGAVAMLAASVLLLLGPRVFIGLLFPMAFMVFLVPFGDEMVPALQVITAKICIALAHWSGIPATIDGIFIDTPAGLFRVAEACSGVKFLIAMLALGALVAHMGFRSWPRRTVFFLLAVMLPVVANGVRAWGTVYIAQSKGMEFAAGFDHIVYGWIFFALVLAVVLAAAWSFFDRPADEPLVDISRIKDSALLGVFDRFEGRGWHVLGVFGLIVLGTVGWSSAARHLSQPEPLRIDLQEVRGWQDITSGSQVSREVGEGASLVPSSESAGDISAGDISGSTSQPISGQTPRMDRMAQTS